ncbi:anthranilate synthase component II [Aquibacillus kalidii]|uniref:anthranilate synthase component II n=1 Tax=Aquibacillus kalidii TaxID=2762597 RepID=UPI0016493D4F|nr:aminodeoxychorismate/anthranilate synthase component II [Aquibacillus kalidii]
MIVIIDNYDSFTYNLVQYYKQITKDVIVFRNDEVTIQQLSEINPDLIVLSPGPGNPTESGLCKQIVHHFHSSIPIFGVCLGFQIIAEYFGSSIVKGIKPMHGKVTNVQHDGNGIFWGISSPTKVTRYHSLIAKGDTIPDDLIVSSCAVDGAVMGVRHRRFPVEGIQFHPESILTEKGFKMIENSFNQALQWKRGVTQ